MKKTHEHCPGSRYIYDFKLFEQKNGWTQLDTKNDAEYYGNWANPFKLIIFSYVEGDCSLTQCENEEEFIAEVREMEKSMNRLQYGLAIDAMMNKEAEEKWKSLGFGDLLYKTLNKQRTIP